MVCTYCSGKTRVVNSRHQIRSNQVWRRRQCLACQAIFTSEETVQYGQAWMVHDGRGKDVFEPFSRDKLLLSIYKCMEHREQPLRDAQGLTETVLQKLSAHVVEIAEGFSDGTIFNKEIARIVQVALNRFDKVAATRYLSLHQRELPQFRPR